MSNAQPKRIELFQYSFLALPLAFASLPLYMHAPDFYTRDLGMNIGLIGFILLAVRFFDAVQDPIIGYISDKKAGLRFLITAIGVACLSAGMGAVFYGPQAGIPVGLWFAISMILATTGFSIIMINLNMIGGFWHDSPQTRTRISAWREAFTLIGLLVASVLPAALQNIKGADAAFEIVFWVFAGIMALAFFLFTRFMRTSLPDHKMHKTRTNKGFAFLSILAGPDKGFYAVCFLTHLAAAMPGVLVLFFIRDYLGAGEWTGLFLFLYFISGAALMQVWVKTADKIGKEQAWLISMVLAAVTFIWAFFLQPGDVIAYGVICVLSGMALGADLALPPSILADRINAQKTESEATQYYALLAFIPKTMIALASGVAFLILGGLAFEAGEQNGESAMFGLAALYALIPSVIKLIAAGLLYVTHKYEGDNYETLERSTAHGSADIS